MEKILLEEFREYETITSENQCINNLEQMSPTTILPLICSNKEKFRKINGLRNINEYNQTNEFENDFKNALNIPESNQNVINFIFNELIGNIYDHSKFNNGYVMGKEFKDFHEISFIDDGITIPQSLKNANHSFENDYEYILEAVNGLSTKNDLGFIERGTGLNNTANIVTNGGKESILIVSGCGLIHIAKDETYVDNLTHCLNGTLISLRIKLDEKIDIYNYLNQINYKN